MSHFSLTYVSASRLPNEVAEREVDRIIAVSHRANPARGVTGALIFSGRSFAQTLEGPEAGVRALLDRILVDPRHDAIRVVHEGPVATRAFAGWSMAYRGVTTYVQRHIDAACADAADTCALELQQLLRALAQT